MTDRQFEMLTERAGIETPTPVKMWTRGVPVEESALKQLANVAAMPFIHHHVAAMPDIHWGMGATVGSVIATKGAIIPAAVGVDIGCFVGETRIPLLDGTQQTLAALATKKEPFWVYSVGPDLNFVPGRAVCLKTREDAKLVRVTVSGGDEIVCTPDHEFMLPDGTYRRADELKFNVSLMPLYRKWQSRDGYESSSLGKGTAACRWHKLREHAQVENHKVISVEALDYTANVYCLQVEEHHNFALAAGVFVHNCGMMASRTSLTASDLPDSLLGIRTAIEAAVPHGRTDNGGPNDRGAWGEPDLAAFSTSGLASDLATIMDKHPKRLTRAAGRAPYHLGTLGTGNHFIEICLDEADHVWIMLHSGSRGIGNAIGQQFIELAKEDMRRWFINLPDADLAYLPEGTQHFDEYIEAVEWAQRFALANRETMMEATISAVRSQIAKPFEAAMMAVNCHHNYVSRERHWGANVMLTRKGAVRARHGDLGIIPGSMGARSYIVRGKGNPDSFCSCSHGAGRKMSRTEARKTFTLEDHATATMGVECRKDDGVLDETPGAYKEIEAVMAAQSDLVEIVHRLRQVVCVKG